MPSSSSSAVKLRLYQDLVFTKRKNKDDITPWYIDGQMIIFDTCYAIKFWIPLYSIPSIDDGGTGLLFINKSHSDFSLPYWNGRGTKYNNDDNDIGYNAYDHLSTWYIIQNVGNNRISDENSGVISHHITVIAPMDYTLYQRQQEQHQKKNSGKVTNHTRYEKDISYVNSRAEFWGDIPGVRKNFDQTKKPSPRKGRSNVFSWRCER